MSKIVEANAIIKQYAIKNFKKNSWAYVDFGLEDRALDEIKSDVEKGEINLELATPEDIAENAIEKIERNMSTGSLLGF